MFPFALALGWWWGDHATAVGAVRDPDIAEQQARAYLAARLPAGTELALVEDRLDGRLRTVTFQQTWHGLPIVGAEAGVVFARDRVLAARDHVIALPAITALGGTGNVILPIGGRLELADAIDDGDDTIFTASDGKLLARTTRRRDAIGALAFDVPKRWPGNGRVQLPAPGAQIAVDGATGTTAADGTFAWTGDAPAPLAVTPTGGVQLIPHDGLATAALTATPDATSVWSLATDEHGDAQLAAYVYATIVLANDVRIEPAYADFVATGIPVFVNEIVPCTAYSSGQSAHFAQAGQGCENTARLEDVVFHELGHVFHDTTYIRGMGAFDTELSEGLADYNAIDLTGDSGVGRGFFGDAAPVRDVSLRRRWPDDLAADPHATGQIIGGALWDLRVAAGADVAETVFHGLVLRAPNIAEAYGAALIEDDDDGDLSNGTPHQCAIDRAFAAHGLQPAYAAIEAGTPASDGHAITIAVARTGTVDPACPPIEVASIAVAWESAGQRSGTLDLAATGDTWSAPLPDVPAGAIVRYTVAITRADGTTTVRPDNPADPQYEALAGDATPLWCAPSDRDPGFTLHGFSYGPLGTDPDASENPHAAFTGTNVVGNTRTSFYGSDVRATAAAPPIDARGHSSVHLQFARWLTVQDFAFDQATVEVNGATAWRNADNAHGTADHIDREWRFVDLDVSDAAAAGTLDVRWTLASNDDGIAYGGWNLDDVCVVAIDAPSEVRAGGGCSGAPGEGMLAAVPVVIVLRRRRR